MVTQFRGRLRSRVVHKALEKFGVPKLRFLIEDLLEKNLMDHKIVVENEDAKNMADRLCREEGLFCGMSSGANVYAAIELARKMKKGSRIVTILLTEETDISLNTQKSIM